MSKNNKERIIETNDQKRANKRTQDVYFKNFVNGKKYCLKRDDPDFDIKFNKLLGSINWELID